MRRILLFALAACLALLAGCGVEDVIGDMLGPREPRATAVPSPTEQPIWTFRGRFSGMTGYPVCVPVSKARHRLCRGQASQSGVPGRHTVSPSSIMAEVKSPQR